MAVISVTGRAETRIAPERAVVSLAVAVQGPEREAVARRASEAHGSLAAELAELAAEPGLLERWSSDDLHATAQRPWNHEGKQLPLVYSANSSFTVVFEDLGRLGEWLGALADRAGVQIRGVDWRLTDATRRSAEAEAQRLAVDDAVRRARVYAEALGLSSPVVLELADRGLLDDGHRPQAVAYARGLAAPAGGGGGEFALEPEPIVVSVEAHARFQAD